MNRQPYVSVVVTARNDDHGGNLLGRMQAFVNAWIGQAKRHGLSSELIVVDWNPPQDRPPLMDALQWPPDTGPCEVRFIQVPPEIHRTYRHAEALPLYQMIAKNVAMRRARGRFILATNIDIIFSDELVRFLAEEKLLPGRMYRMDRIDVGADVPVDGSVDEQLEYCATHLIRICAREGFFELTPDGLRKLVPDDIAAQDSGIYFGEGWQPIERYSPEEKFRWVENDAEVVVDLPSDPAPQLIVELEPGPGVCHQPFLLQVRDVANTVLAESIVTQRQKLQVQLPADGPRVAFRFHVPMGGAPRTGDPRIMNFRVFSCHWAKPQSPDAESPAARPEGLSSSDEYKLMAGPLEHSRWSRAMQFYADAGGPLGALRAAMLRRSRSRFFVRNVPMNVDVFETVHGVSAGVGWHEREHFLGETFRWSKGAESELIVSAPHDGPNRLGIQIEPGPGVGSGAFELLVRDEAGEIVARTVVERLRYTEIALPCKAGRSQVFTLSADRGGRPCPNGDPRVLNFRVFWCGWAGHSHESALTLSPGSPQASTTPGFRWGRGWGAPEVADSGQHYRAGSPGAEILVCPPFSQASAAFLEVEPVAGTGAFTLEIRDHAGRTLASVDLDGRRKVHIPLPIRAERTAALELCVAGDQGSAPRFRVFQWIWSTRWGAHDSQSQGGVWKPSSQDSTEARRPGSNAAHLHINACGDFTLMARENWFELRGYPEFDLFSFNIDQIFCYTAHHAGFREEMLGAPMRCYHIEHGLGSGWTPEGQAKLFERLRARGLSWVDYPEIVVWIDQMRRFHSTMIFNLENWGLADYELPETVVRSLERVQTSS